MRRFISLSLFLATSLTAQARTEFGIVAINPVGLNGTCTNFTSRGGLGSNAGSILVEVPGANISGVGHTSAPGTLFYNFHYLTQDQNATTVEAYSMEIRGEANPGPGPDCAATLMQLTGLSLPAGAGTLAWMLTNTLGTPSNAVPQCDTFFMGASVAATAAWPADGQSFHMGSYYLLQGSTASNPAPNAPDIAWNCLAGASLQVPGSPRTYRFYLGVNAAVLNMANHDPLLTGAGHCLSTAPAPYTNIDTGPGGLWPQCQGTTGLRNDGLQARVLDALAPNGLFVVFIGTPLPCASGLSVPAFFEGQLYLNPGALISLASGSLDAAGVGVIPLIPPNFPCVRLTNRVVDFQAFTVGSALTLPGRVSNRAGVRYLP
jgi:hypothetical protein